MLPRQRKRGKLDLCETYQQRRFRTRIQQLSCTQAATVECSSTRDKSERIGWRNAGLRGLGETVVGIRGVGAGGTGVVDAGGRWMPSMATQGSGCLPIIVSSAKSDHLPLGADSMLFASDALFRLQTSWPFLARRQPTSLYVRLLLALRCLAGLACSASISERVTFLRSQLDPHVAPAATKLFVSREDAQSY